mmetsp:Transcript_6360/g.15378  ORF Transcript_6360/g.15378 Transcript_6360/m.15378 type:complete len:321 (-) Transcript_6360:328-1290(-)
MLQQLHTKAHLQSLFSIQSPTPHVENQPRENCLGVPVILQTNNNLARFPESEPTTNCLHVRRIANLGAAGAVASEGHENGLALALAHDEHRHKAERERRHQNRDHDASDGPASQLLHCVVMRLIDGSARPERVFAGRAEQVVLARVVPVVAEGSLDRHLRDLPGVVLTAGAGTVVVGAIRVLAVVTGEGLALVEARLLHEETLARLRERAAAVPVELGAVGILDHVPRGDGLVLAARLVLPRPALVVAVELGARRFLVVVIAMQLARRGARFDAQRNCRRLVGVFAELPPHGVRLVLVRRILEGAVPHVLAQLLAALVDL